MPRKQKKIHYLYKTTCLITEKYYIGIHSTSNIEDGYMGSGKRLRRSIRKYGVENHKKEILSFYPDRESLIESEISVVNSSLLLDDKCMNLKNGGTGGFVNDEHRKKFIEGSKKTRFLGNEKLKWLFLNDKEWAEEHKKKVSEGLKKINFNHNTFSGKKHTIESKNKISKTSKGNGVGNKNSQYGTCWITKDGLNKKIKKDTLNLFLDKGWKSGRVP
jgi:hypothetical protein